MVIKKRKSLGMKEMQSSKETQLVVRMRGVAREVTPASSSNKPLPKEPSHLRNWGTEA